MSEVRLPGVDFASAIVFEHTFDECRDVLPAGGADDTKLSGIAPESIGELRLHADQAFPHSHKWGAVHICNLYSITTNQAAIAGLFRVINRYVGNFAPYPAPVIRNSGGKLEMTMMRWGMPPR